ncbi:hypothetical protein C0J52_19582 [Blattella germanica]|nr:hypothetical protein C0J52_19582 [Blattella germanica]
MEEDHGTELCGKERKQAKSVVRTVKKGKVRTSVNHVFILTKRQTEQEMLPHTEAALIYRSKEREQPAGT